MKLLMVLMFLCLAGAEACHSARSRPSLVISEEKRLTKFLLENYERVGIQGRPVLDASQALEVKFGLSLQNILDIDFERETLTTLVWYNYEWKDALLQWEPEDFGNVQSVRLNADDIYTPDITPYYDVPGHSHFKSPHIVVYHDGLCAWLPPGTLTTICTYPEGKDTEAISCGIKFGSWTFDGSKLNLTSSADKVDISTYTPKPGWVLESVPMTRNVMRYDCCPEPYIDITATLNMKKE